MLAAATVGAAALLAAGAPWQTIEAPADGFSIAVPARWQVVPQSTPRLNATIAELRKAKQTQLALQFQAIAAIRRATHTVYRFQAFAWPPPAGAVVPDVTVKIDPVTAGTTAAALPTIARDLERTFAQSSSTTVVAPVALSLPAGPAVEVAGTARVSKTVRSRFAIYLLIRGHKLYSVSFRGPETAVERQVLRSFRLVG